MNRTAFLDIYWEHLSGGRVRCKAHWRGPKSAPVAVGWESLRGILRLSPDFPPRNLYIDGIPLRLVGVEEHTRACLFVRADAGWGLPWLFWRVAHLVHPAASLFVQRLILTLQVWGLAYVPYGEIPSPSHVGRKRP